MVEMRIGRTMEELWEASESGMGEEVSLDPGPSGEREEEPIVEGATTHESKVQDQLVINQDEPWVNIVLGVATANTR